MNKLKFNNLVISNKKKIKQIKAQTISKLVQKLHKQKTLVEKKPDERNKQRFRKCQETMEQLKQLKIVDLVKNVLLLDKNPTAVVTNGRATPEEVAVALLAQNKIMQQMAKCFRDELNLSETDPSWKNELLEASKRRLKIIRTEEKRLKRTSTKEQKALERKRNEWLQENVTKRDDADEEQNTNEDDTKNVSISGDWKIAVIDAKANQKDEETNEQRSVDKELKKPNNSKKRNKEAEKKKMQSLEFVRVVPEKRLKLDINKKDLSIKSVELSKQVKIEHEEPRLEDSTAREEAESAASDNTSERATTHVVDPFFITDTGENYLSSAVIIRGENESQASNKQHTVPVVFGETRAKRRADARNKQNGHREQPQRNRQAKRDNYKQSAKPQHQQKEVSAAPAANLHPSWAAKQKQKPVISSFLGKKIIFDNND